MAQLNAYTYSGCYGASSENNGDLVVVDVTCGDRPITMKNKEIVLVIDKSGSMRASMDILKASMLAFRDSMVHCLHPEETHTQEELDDLFKRECQIKLIMYDTDATLIWASSQDDAPSFSSVINSLCSGGCTDIGKALNLAFEVSDPECFSWIVLMTDGQANEGQYRREESFHQLIQDHKNSRSSVIALGYGSDFAADILYSVGAFTYIDNCEKIAPVFGSIAGEVVSSWGYDARIALPQVMCYSDLTKNAKAVIGSPDVGILYNENRFIYGYLPWGNNHLPTFGNALWSDGVFEYVDIQTQEKVTHHFPISYEGVNVPSWIKAKYYECSKGRIMLSIYVKGKRGSLDHSFVTAVKGKLDGWTDPEALAHKEEILACLDLYVFGGAGNQAGYACLATSCDIRNQNTYISAGQSSVKNAASQVATQSSGLYSVTDLKYQSSNEIGRWNMMNSGST